MPYLNSYERDKSKRQCYLKCEIGLFKSLCIIF